MIEEIDVKWFYLAGIILAIILFMDELAYRHWKGMNRPFTQWSGHLGRHPSPPEPPRPGAVTEKTIAEHSVPARFYLQYTPSRYYIPPI